MSGIIRKYQEGLTGVEILVVILVLLVVGLVALAAWLDIGSSKQKKCSVDTLILYNDAKSFDDAVKSAMPPPPVPQSRIDELLEQCSEVNAQIDKVNTQCEYTGTARQIVALDCEAELRPLSSP